MITRKHYHFSSRFSSSLFLLYLSSSFFFFLYLAEFSASPFLGLLHCSSLFPVCSSMSVSLPALLSVHFFSLCFPASASSLSISATSYVCFNFFPSFFSSVSSPRNSLNQEGWAGFPFPHLEQPSLALIQPCVCFLLRSAQSTGEERQHVRSVTIEVGWLSALIGQCQIF